VRARADFRKFYGDSQPIALKVAVIRTVLTLLQPIQDFSNRLSAKAGLSRQKKQNTSK